MEKREKFEIFIICILLIAVSVLVTMKFMDKESKSISKSESNSSKEEINSKSIEYSDSKEVDQYDVYIKGLNKRDGIKQISAGYPKAYYYLGTDNVLYSFTTDDNAPVIPNEPDVEGPSLRGNKTSVTDAVDAFACEFGNGGFYHLYVLKTDGILYEVDYNNNYALSATEYKNIVSVNQYTSGDATNCNFVDINGKTYIY